MKLGLIGGVSPFAFAEIYCNICRNYRNIYGEYPEILVYSIKCSKKDEDEYLYDKEQKSIAIITEIESACRFFSKNGVENVGICCNTLSIIFKNIAKKYRFKKIITPVDAVNNVTKKVQGYFLFATKFTNDAKLYGLNVNYLTDENQAIIDKVLSNKISGKKYDSYNILMRVIRTNNIRKIILGCTDFSENDFRGMNLDILNSSKLFVNECVEVLKCAE